MSTQVGGGSSPLPGSIIRHPRDSLEKRTGLPRRGRVNEPVLSSTNGRKTALPVPGNRNEYRLVVRRAWPLMAVLAVALVGCEWANRGPAAPMAPQSPAPSAPASNRADRLAANYPDLSTGRFLLIADFEQPEQLELFNVQSHSGRAAFKLTPGVGVPQTGRNALQVTFANPKTN